MVGNLLLRGMVAGVIAGILVFAFARFFGEPLVDAAIAFEEATAQAAGEAAEPEIVSRAKILVHRGEANEGNVIEVLEALHHELANLV